MRTLLAVSILVAMVGLARAQPTNTAGYLAPHCRDFLAGPSPIGEDRAFMAGRCAGSVYGLLTIGSALKDKLFCPPIAITLASATEVIVKFFDEHPERMGEEFLSLASGALGAEWPCPN